MSIALALSIYNKQKVGLGGLISTVMGQLTNTSRGDGAPDPDGSIKEVVRIKTRHYRNVYLNHPEPMFLHDHHEPSVLTNELAEESDQFLFL